MIDRQRLIKFDTAPELYLQAIANGDAIIRVEAVEGFSGELAAKQPVAKDRILGLGVGNDFAHRRRFLRDLESQRGLQQHAQA